VEGELYKGVPHGLCKVKYSKDPEFEGYGVMTHGKLDQGPFLYKRKDGFINSFSTMTNGRAYCVGKGYDKEDPSGLWYLGYHGQF
jgi:hypothetical protein